MPKAPNCGRSQRFPHLQHAPLARRTRGNFSQCVPTPKKHRRNSRKCPARPPRGRLYDVAKALRPERRGVRRVATRIAPGWRRLHARAITHLVVARSIAKSWCGNFWKGETFRHVRVRYCCCDVSLLAKRSLRLWPAKLCNTRAIDRTPFRAARESVAACPFLGRNTCPPKLPPNLLR